MNDERNKHLEELVSKPINQKIQIVSKTHFSPHKIVVEKSSEETPLLVIPHTERQEFARRFTVVTEEAAAKPAPVHIPSASAEKPIVPIVSAAKPVVVTKTISAPAAPPPRKKMTRQKSGWFGEIFRLAFTAGALFSLFFVGVNYKAFSQIVDKKLNPDKFTEAQIELENVVKRHTPDLLPVAGMKRENRKEFPLLSISVSPLENRIVIPSIGKNIPIIEIDNQALLAENWKALETDIQEGLRNGVVHYPGTAVPGQYGNTFITGHSSYYPWDNGKFKDVFALLHDTEVGETFTVYWNQKKYDYKIREKKVVSPKDTSVLDQPTDGKIATLMTCTPVGTAKNRLIIVADQIE